MNSFSSLAKYRPAFPKRTLLSLSVLATAAVCADAQHLSLQSASPATTLIEAAAAPERIAFVRSDAAFFPPSTPSLLALSTAQGPTAETAESSDSLPENPPPLPSTASALGATATTATDPGQFASPDPAKYPKAADGRPIAPLYTKYIPAGWAYQPVHGRQKLILGLRDLYTPSDFLGMIASAGWSHVTNGQPNYGTDRGAYGERLGAAAIRQTAQSILTDGVFSVLYHQDPRYFTEGPKYSFVHRALYAATRPLIVRTSDGKGSTVNFSLLSGYAAAAVLNDAYYPTSNRNAHDTLASFGGSIGGAAVGFLVGEFTEDALEILHLKKKP